MPRISNPHFRRPSYTSPLWEAAKHLFTWYVTHIARYSIFYGSLSTLVIFVLWAYYSSTILVVGAEFAYFLEEDRQRQRLDKAYSGRMRGCHKFYFANVKQTS
jgi:uncharacterized BrkB/YihY/UPF0761 family membrane protein